MGVKREHFNSFLSKGLAKGLINPLYFIKNFLRFRQFQPKFRALMNLCAAQPFAGPPKNLAKQSALATGAVGYLANHGICDSTAEAN